jgi:hypothetical protein
MSSNAINVHRRFWYLIAAIFALNFFAVFQGFTNVDEADIVFDIFKIYRNLAVERDLSFMVWPDTGMNGPLHYYIYTVFLFPFSYFLRIPIDIVLRTLPLLTLPITSLYLYRAFNKLFDVDTAVLSTLLFVTSAYYTMYNTLCVGEFLYTLLLAISFYYLFAARNRKDVYLSFMFFAIPLMIKYTFITLLPLYPLYLVLNKRVKNVRPVDYVLWTCIVGAGFLPLLISVMLNGTGFLSRFTQIAPHMAMSFTGKIRNLLYFLFFGLGPVILGLSVIGLIPFRRVYTKKDVFVACGIVVSIMAVLLIGAVTFRYSYPLIFPVFFLVGMGVSKIQNVKTSRWIYVLLLINFMFTFYTQVLNNYQPHWRNNLVRYQSIYKRAGFYVIQNSAKDDIVALRNPTSFYVFGKRQMILNPLYETLQKVNDTYFFQFKMSGIHDYHLNDRIKYFIIDDSEKTRYDINPDFLSLLSLEKKIGSLGIYKNRLYIELQKPPASEELRYDLYSIVQDYYREGLQAPVMQ